GRAFEPADRPEAPQVAIVNRTLAEQQWPAGDAVGRRLAISWGEWEEVKVVGVVEDVVGVEIGQPIRGMIYLPYAQKPWFSLHLTVRSPLPPHEVRDLVVREVRALDP